MESAAGATSSQAVMPSRDVRPAAARPRTASIAPALLIAQMM